MGSSIFATHRLSRCPKDLRVLLLRGQALPPRCQEAQIVSRQTQITLPQRPVQKDYPATEDHRLQMVMMLMQGAVHPKCADDIRKVLVNMEKRATSPILACMKGKGASQAKRSGNASERKRRAAVTGVDDCTHLVWATAALLSFRTMSKSLIQSRLSLGQRN